MITLEKINSVGFNDVEQIEDNIFLIKNFISSDCLQELNSLIFSLSENDWSSLNYQMHSDNWMSKMYDFKNESLIHSIRNQLAKIASLDPDLSPSGGDRILRQFPGSGMDAHVDEIDDNNGRCYRRYAAVIYINDDYEGGELHYIKKNIAVKPPAGSLMLFKTGPDYLHEVKKVTGQNTRYCIPVFMFEFYTE